MLLPRIMPGRSGGSIGDLQLSSTHIRLSGSGRRPGCGALSGSNIHRPGISLREPSRSYAETIASADAACVESAGRCVDAVHLFRGGDAHPFEPLDTGLSLRNAWWLCDAALLAYSPEPAVQAAFTTAGIPGDVVYFHGLHSTQAYVASMPDAIVLAFRGTQLDDFWSSVLDFTVDAHFLPFPDSHGDLVHAGFLAALREVWPQARRTRPGEQARQPRPLWITGHSLGAALSGLAATLCSDEPSLRLQGVYTFGSPRVGDAGIGAGSVYRCLGSATTPISCPTFRSACCSATPAHSSTSTAPVTFTAISPPPWN